MTTGHERWPEFVACLEGPEGCNFEETDHDFTWDCDHTHRYAARILLEMGLEPEDVARSIDYFKSHGGHCDCEVLFNVFAPSDSDLASERTEA
jgi:hypothetical protein